MLLHFCDDSIRDAAAAVVSWLLKGGHGSSDWFTKLSFESGHKFRVPLNTMLSVEDVMSSKTIAI